MKSKDIVAEVKCAIAEHPSKCSVCASIITLVDADHVHYTWATENGFKPLDMHGTCAKAWRAGTAQAH